MIERVCVYCGSSAGRSTTFGETADRFGRVLAARNLTLVYGGGSVGLMGRVADATMQAGGRVIGVIPSALVRLEVAHLSIPDLHVVANMHERKARMADLADAFVAMPGGLGTLDEMFEMLTWAQLGIHRKPCAFLDVDGYFGPLMAFLDVAVDRGFVKPQHRAMFIVDTDPDRLIDRLSAAVPPSLEKWVDRSDA